jgi:large subunit ribosomal protein L25
MTASNTSAKTAILNAETRENAGKGVARALRREGKVPAIMYGNDKEPVSLALNANELRQQYLKGRFQSRLVELKLNGKDVVKALPRDVQFHPVTDQIEHVDFQQVDPAKATHVYVPVKFVGNEKSIGLKRGGVLNIVRHEIEFYCKPDSIPHHIELDTTNMNIGDAIHIKDVKLPEGVIPVIKRNFTIATIAGRGKEEEAAPVAAAAAAPAADAAKDAAKKDDKK